MMGYWGGGAKRAYHHTAPVNSLYGLHESLVMLQEEGIENSWQRHADMHWDAARRCPGDGARISGRRVLSVAAAKQYLYS